MSMFLVVGALAAIAVVAVVLALKIGKNAALACGAAGILLLGMTYAEAQLSDRWATTNVTAEEFVSRFNDVPKVIGDWEGEDLDVIEQVRKTAGAVGYVSRLYTNTKTNKHVKLWLIVGHSRDICRHTPDVCYPSSGAHKQSSENIPYTMTFDGVPAANFWTNTFLIEGPTGRSLDRVFWTWFKPTKDSDEAVAWEAPEYQRFRFGNARALYKMYFTSAMPGPSQTADESPCIAFAKEVLPVVNAALANSAPMAG